MRSLLFCFLFLYSLAAYVLLRFHNEMEVLSNSSTDSLIGICVFIFVPVLFCCDVLGARGSFATCFLVSTLSV
jgi:hypothetical protein